MNIFKIGPERVKEMVRLKSQLRNNFLCYYKIRRSHVRELLMAWRRRYEGHIYRMKRAVFADSNIA
jgi:hypothetical protein